MLEKTQELIKTNLELCTGCNRCVRECPMETANITYQDENGNIKVKIDHTKCIVCGRCVSACNHHARQYADDTGLFFDDLSKGVQISLIAAPSVRTNIPEYKRLFTYLKKLGVRKIYDVSLGADICIWAHVRYIERAGRVNLITQPCPAIVTYCEKYQHALLDNLSPIHSPMACAAVYMKEYQGVTDRIAALSPCVAKANEFQDTGLIQYNVTFAKLLEYLKDNNITLPVEETGFDHNESGLGSLFPMPGGLKENIEFFMGKTIQISRAEGFSVYEKLNTYAETPVELLPGIFDVLNCSEGCNLGTACMRDRNIFEIERTMDDGRKAACSHEKKYFESVYQAFDDKFDFSHFIRKYRPVQTSFPKITDEDIQAAFSVMKKYDDASRNVDCGACGSDTCLNMARKIALKVNIPISCMVMTIENAKKDHAINLNILEQFETIWKSVENGTAIIDAETREILNINPSAIRLFGGAKEDVIGKHCQDVFCPAQQCPILDLNQVVDRSDRKFVKSDGTIIPIVKSVAKIHYKGRPALLESFTDVSHIKEAEEQKRMLEVAEQASKAKSAFLANMSHEIRTPMNAIIGMASIGMSAADVERKDYCFGKINDASRHLLGIINDVLDMSKIESGKFELSPSEIDFEEILHHVINVNKIRIEEKQQHFTVRIDKTIPKTLIGDEQRITQVITNLLSNAVKFTPEKGSISIDTQLLKEENNVCTIQVSVTDSGIGLSPEQQAGLFESFQQAENSTSRKYGGTGLGLAISKNIVEMMDGKIWIESELGKGSTFAFTMQAKRVEEKQKTLHKCDEDARQKVVDFEGCHILLAEDVEINREIVLTLLEPTLIAIDCAENGVEAVRKFNEAPEKYDMIFMDLQMPEMDGYEATQRIRALPLPKAKDIPIIAMTANVFRDDVEKCLAAGMNNHIGKPINLNEVLGILSTYLPK